MTFVASEEKVVELDEVLSKFNIFGKYYGWSILWIFIGLLSNATYCANYVFVAEHTGFRCKDESFGNNTCWHPTNTSVVCEEWIYDNPNTFVAEFQLACQEWKRTFVGTVHCFGHMVGLLMVGPLSDKFGRKAMIVTTGVLGGVFGLARSFTSWYWLYVALEFLEATIGDICSPIYMLCIEMVSSKKRLIFKMLCAFGLAFGDINLTLMAWLIPYWRNLLRALYAPALLFFFYLFLIEESPRWLLSKGKKEKAIKILKKAAGNKVNFDDSMLDKLTCEETKGVSLIVLLKDTFASSALLKRFFVCLSWWMTSTFVNYGLTINSVSLEGNKYLNYAILAAFHILGIMVATFVLIRYSRKIPLTTSFFAAAILCLTQPFVPTNLPWLSILLFMLGKLMSAIFFDITYLFTSELFPTYTRNSMHALCSSLGRIGSILAPQTPLLMYYWSGLPSIFFGSACLVAGLATFFVPDTSDNALPDTIRQAEAIGKTSKVAKNQIVPIEKIESCRL